ncbi:hypothetical protein AT05_10560 [Schleiferia thermophila str. Yellowstone]|nr:hypothetical protein AT05_10560 [Schleiferia thermophila str. Yellowstone]
MSYYICIFWELFPQKNLTTFENKSDFYNRVDF